MLEFIGTYYLVLARFVFVVLAILIFIQLKRQLFHRSGGTHVLGVLDIEDGSMRLPITHFETTIGRAKSCDVVIPLQIISRQHAVLTFSENGYWNIVDTNSKGGIFVNGNELEPDTQIDFGDEIELAGMRLVLKTANILDAEGVVEEEEKKKKRIGQTLLNKLTGENKKTSVTRTILYMNLFQILALLQLLFTAEPGTQGEITVSFVFIMILPWGYRLLAKYLGIENITAELTAFFLVTLGICATASAIPQSLYKQLVAIVLGLVIFSVMCMVLKNLSLTMKLRRYAAMASFALLGLNLLLGSTINGQNNWIRIGSLSIQPSEFVKILFIFASCATLEWLMTTKNVARLAVYSVGCIGLLALMGDFGTALIFFFAFLVLTFMTSGDIRAVILSVVGAGMGGILILKFKPYIMDRFGAWRKVWDFLYDQGFQQTRALMAIASGGFLGLGGGNGFLKDVFAADTDLVFGIIAEEWGMIIALLMVSLYVLLLISAIRSHQRSRSSYYVIAACATASIFLFQAALNIFGTTDILPLTGVTLPFVSNGGSSMMASFGMLSFITATLNFTRPKIKKRRVEAGARRREVGEE